MEISIKQGANLSYKAKALYDDGSTEDVTDSVDWNSSNEDVASIDDSGMATGMSAGKTWITASMIGISNNEGGFLEVISPPVVADSLHVSDLDGDARARRRTWRAGRRPQDADQHRHRRPDAGESANRYGSGSNVRGHHRYDCASQVQACVVVE